MKNYLRESKAITLIALILTVVVLLILAVVTINAINDGGIFQYANNAATKYNSAAIGENSLITNYLSDMQKYGNIGENPVGEAISLTGYGCDEDDGLFSTNMQLIGNNSSGSYSGSDIGNGTYSVSGNIITFVDAGDGEDDEHMMGKIIQWDENGVIMLVNTDDENGYTVLAVSNLSLLGNSDKINGKKFIDREDTTNWVQIDASGVSTYYRNSAISTKSGGGPYVISGSYLYLGGRTYTITGNIDSISILGRNDAISHIYDVEE